MREFTELLSFVLGEYGIPLTALILNVVLVWWVFRYLGKRDEQFAKRDEQIAEDKKRDDERVTKLLEIINDFKIIYERQAENADYRHREHLSEREKIRQASIDQVKIIEDHTKGIATMSDRFEGLEEAVRETLSMLADVLETGVKLDKNAKEDIIQEVTARLKTTMTQCLEDAIKRTQETPKIEQKQDEQSSQSKSHTTKGSNK